jgi:predicted protein tyrosine phosphatase
MVAEPTAMNVLFLGSRNKRRSPTAEALFSGEPGVATRSAGTEDDAVSPVEPDDIVWADLVLAMEQKHAKKLRQLFGDLVAGKVRVLRIRDDYEADDPVLIELLQRKVTPLLL